MISLSTIKTPTVVSFKWIIIVFQIGSSWKISYQGGIIFEHIKLIFVNKRVMITTSKKQFNWTIIFVFMNTSFFKKTNKWCLEMVWLKINGVFLRETRGSCNIWTKYLNQTQQQWAIVEWSNQRAKRTYLAAGHEMKSRLDPMLAQMVYPIVLPFDHAYFQQILTDSQF